MTDRMGEPEGETSAKPSQPTDRLLEVRGLKVHFPIRQGLLFDRTVGAVQAVDGVDLDVLRGRTFGLVGESGCGKSTLGRAILRLVEPTAGSVVFDGVDVASLQGERLRLMRRRMQMVFQDPLASLNPTKRRGDHHRAVARPRDQVRQADAGPGGARPGRAASQRRHEVPA